MRSKKRNIIVYVMKSPKGAVESIRRYERSVDKKFRIMVIWDENAVSKKEHKDFPGVDIFLKIDFTRDRSIPEALAPYMNELRAITCRDESYLSRFIQIIPHVPYLRTPSTESLKWSTDKLEMRRRFALLAKPYSPKYALVKGNTAKERLRIIEKIQFPMIVKPTNLAQSLLVSVCYDAEELKKTLTIAYKKIKKIYAENGRTETPKCIVEEFMEGDMYSVDAYVNGKGTIYFCPMARVITGRNAGRDDFFGYIQMSPTGLKKRSIDRAHEAANAGIHALGLRNTTAHVELMKVDDEWKIIEIGARVGGFRDVLHRLSCDIDHSLNDVLIRLPKKPIIPKKCKGYAACFKCYAKQEGIITSIRGLRRVEKLASCNGVHLLKKLGDRATFAKNGGKAVCTITLYNNDRSKLLADMRRVEKMVSIEVA